MVALMPIVGSATSASAIECPEAAAVQIGAIDEGAQKSLSSELQAVAADNDDALKKLVGRVRSLAPDASRLDITNFLIGLYCPFIAARKDLNESAKTERVSAFATRVAAILY